MTPAKLMPYETQSAMDEMRLWPVIGQRFITSSGDLRNDPARSTPLQTALV
jgi:hypothetical protein